MWKMPGSGLPPNVEFSFFFLTGSLYHLNFEFRHSEWNKPESQEIKVNPNVQ